MATVSERLREAMELRELSQSEIVTKTGIGKSSISTYLSGAYEPKQKNIYKLAKVLNVSEPWLMGLDVPMERIEPVEINNVNNGLTVSEKKLLAAFRMLNEQGQENALATIEGLTYISQYKKGDEYSMVEKSS